MEVDKKTWSSLAVNYLTEYGKTSSLEGNQAPVIKSLVTNEMYLAKVISFERKDGKLIYLLKFKDDSNLEIVKEKENFLLTVKA